MLSKITPKTWVVVADGAHAKIYVGEKKGLRALTPTLSRKNGRGSDETLYRSYGRGCERQRAGEGCPRKPVATM